MSPWQTVPPASCPTPPRPAVCRPAQTWPWYVWVLHSTKLPDMHCMKRCRSTGHQPGTKSASRPAVNPRMNRLSTADFVSAFGLHRISLDRAFAEWSVSIGFRLIVLLEGRFKRHVFDASEGTGDACLLDELCCRHPVLPGPAPPARRTPRPDPPVVCPGFGLDRLNLILFGRASGGNSGQLSTMLWGDALGARGSVVSWANRPIGVLSCLAPPCAAARQCAAPHSPAHGMSRFGSGQVRFAWDFVCPCFLRRIVQDGLSRTVCLRYSGGRGQGVVLWAQDSARSSSSPTASPFRPAGFVVFAIQQNICPRHIREPIRKPDPSMVLGNFVSVLTTV